MSGFSFQLYSARKFPPLKSVLSLLRRLGYGSVEGFGDLYDDPDSLKTLLDRHGLTMRTGHFDLDRLKDTDRTVAVARALGIEALFCPAVPQALWSQPEDGWKRLAGQLAELGETYRREGFGFGWHNHHFEFRPTASGALPMDIILEGAPDIDWEADIAWMVRGGQDPRDWIERHGHRITAVHVKDLAPEGGNADEDGWADVGHGTIAWDVLMPLLREKTRADHYVMEHDNPSDLERFAARSIAAARTY